MTKDISLNTIGSTRVQVESGETLTGDPEMVSVPDINRLRYDLTEFDSAKYPTNKIKRYSRNDLIKAWLADVAVAGTNKELDLKAIDLSKNSIGSTRVQVNTGETLTGDSEMVSVLSVEKLREELVGEKYSADYLSRLSRNDLVKAWLDSRGEPEPLPFAWFVLDKPESSSGAAQQIKDILESRNVDWETATDLNAGFDLIELSGAGQSSFRRAFKGFQGVKVIKLRNSENVTNYQEAFWGCSELEYVEGLDTSNANSADHMFRECPKIETLSLDLSKVETPVIDIVANSYSLREAEFFGLKRSTSIKNLSFEALEIDAFLDSLGEVEEGTNTVDISNNPGTAECDPAIAEAKGWVVVTE